MTKIDKINELIKEWSTNPRWKGIERPYTAEEVVKLQGSYRIEHTIAKMGAETLWRKMQSQDYVARLFNRKPSCTGGTGWLTGDLFEWLASSSRC